MKKQKSFSHLHVHSEYSILNGVSSVSNWYKKASEKGIKSIAFTEYSNMSSSMESFLKSQDYKDIKCIFGLDCYIVEDIELGTQEEVVTLIAKNKIGYDNLLQLGKISWTKGFYAKRNVARVDYKILKKYSKGIYCLTGSNRGPVALSLKAGFFVAEKVFQQLHNIFGNNLLAEIQFDSSEDQILLNKAVIKFAKTYGVRCVITNDCHYINKGEHKLYEFVKKIEVLSQKYIKRGGEKVSKSKWLKSYSDIKKDWSKKHKYISRNNFDKYINNTNKIASNCNVELEIGKHQLPVFPIKTHDMYESWMKDSIDLFKHIAKAGFKEKISKKSSKYDVYLKRFDYELNFIIDAGFANYFLIIDDIVRYAKKNKIEVGEARGSVAGSLVAYCMITNIDPIKFDLMFERFLNPARISGERAKSADALPDIDLDFEKVGRPLIKKYIIEKWGEDCVCTIGTFGTMKIRSLLRDCDRVFEGKLPYKKGKRKKCSEIEMELLLKELAYSGIDKLDDAISKSEKFVEFYKKFPYLVDFYFKNLDGQIRGVGQHAAAVLIAPSTITDWIPIKTQKLKDEVDRVVVSQWRDKDCERRGLVKIDVLGIKTLNVFKRCREDIKKKYNRDIVFTRDISLKDKKVLRLFDKSKTDGVFQYNSQLFKGYFRTFKVDGFEDLIVVASILRPGPMDMGSHEKYAACKEGSEEPTYIHKSIKKYMKKTYGIYVFQEDVMRTASVLGGLTLAEADIMRTAMKKKDPVMMNQFEKKYVKGCMENRGLPKKKAKNSWKELAAFFAYGFNRCLDRRSKITMANGKERPLIWLYHQHQAGNELYLKSRDMKTGEIVNNKVKEVVYAGKKNVGKLQLERGDFLWMTSRHAVGIQREDKDTFRMFKDLRKDDLIYRISKNKKYVDLNKIDSKQSYYEERYEVDVYDIVMEGEPRNFFANNMLVHNSHAASYAFNGYICQWLKVYYPEIFWAATLEYADTDVKKKENIWSFRKIILSEGIKFRDPIAISKKSGFYLTKKGKITWPISAIKGVGEKSAIAIAKACRENSPKTLSEFYSCIPRRNINKRVMNVLIACDAFCKFGHPKDIAKEYYIDLRKEKTGIPEMFQKSKKDKDYWYSIKENALGYMDRSFTEQYVNFFSSKASKISELKSKRDGSFVVVGGKIKKKPFKYNTRYGKMFFINVYDIDGEFTIVAIPSFCKKNSRVSTLKEGDIIEVLGVKEISKKGETNVVLKDDSSSQLEVLEDIG